MKAIQVLFDEQLLARLDATDEVQKDGRSAVLRRAAADYLNRRRRHAIAESYRQAYGAKEGPGDEFPGWDGQREWPEP